MYEKYKYHEVFCENTHASRHTVKRWYRSITTYECIECKNTGIYNNKPLTLQLDHINGNPKDCRVENLRWLCPNCHSQTPTYAGSREDGLGCKKPSNYKKIHLELASGPVPR